ncbi:MAG: hypothetical protein WCP97_07370 [bacterium]
MSTSIRDKLLEKESKFYDRLAGSSVWGSVEHFFEFIEQKQLIFFPEYTDHGINHVKEVLKWMSNLIPKKTQKILTTTDCEFIVISALLHDIGLHYTGLQFEKLLSDDTKQALISSDKKWRDLWDEYQGELLHYGDRELKVLFGSLFDENFRVTSDDFNYSSKIPSEKQKVIFGNFIRIHHERIAHEVAVYGLPTDGEPLTLSSLNEKERKFAGYIARSHRLDLRQCFEYVGKLANDEEAYKVFPTKSGNTHPIYLMALLKIADTITEFDPNRYPEILSRTRYCQSEKAKVEHQTHQSISSTTIDELKDPERIKITIDIEKLDAELYFQAKKRKKKFQDELDTTWAVLGEVYGLGSKNTLALRGLAVRRVYSQCLDSESELTKAQQGLAPEKQFIPKPAAFGTANAEVLNLLIGPLYGNRPEIGIRELMQNAVDACRELEDYCNSNKKELESIATNKEQESDVLIALEEKDGKKWIRISDKGIGMTVDTIQNYFLKAGASFRNSIAWKQEHVDDDTRKSRVLRSGRFGVGVLAAFLLGETIRVRTRHVDSDAGIEFEASINTDPIVLKPCECFVGTEINIFVTDKIWRNLVIGEHSMYPEGVFWDWYCLEKPTVLRKINNQIIKQSYVLPEAAEHGDGEPRSVKKGLPVGWYRIGCADFKDIHWTYIKIAPSIACNGIIVDENVARAYRRTFVGLKRTISIKAPYMQLSLALPSLSVFDAQAKLPLNLERNHLEEDDLPFISELKESVIKDFLAFCLVNAPEIKKISNEILNNSYPGLKLKGIPQFLFTPQGVLFNSPYFLNKVMEDVVTVIPQFLNMTHQVNDLFGDEFSKVALLAELSVSSYRDFSEEIKWIDEILQLRRGVDGVNYYQSINTKNAIIIVRTTILNKIKTRIKQLDFSFLLDDVWTLIGVAWAPISEQVFIQGKLEHYRKLISNDISSNPDHPGLIAEITIDMTQKFRADIAKDDISEQWEQYFGNKPIPYLCAKERINSFKNENPIGFSALEPYIETQLELKNKNYGNEEVEHLIILNQ